ncbi:cytochrome P450 9e2-like [Pseudomyrmex gracilis]|uniref:cytochrome P450 9e2-like n=1 Tax=Pseudomyrmex gracilis TaxID=219809 RepID=UPI000995BA48|nr:cytochrome P450 9e2-like [Pseudomyrmex gracilis]
MDFWSILLSVIIGVFGINYLFKHFNFFKRHNVIHIPSVPIFGSMTSLVFRQISFVDFTKKMYNLNPDAKYIGMYATTNPVFLLRDPELIRTVLIKHFEIFPNRRGFSDFNDPLFSKNLFSLQGETWRKVRNLLSPSFTSSKMKNMFTLMSECAVDFAKHMSKLSVNDTDTNIKDAFTKYTNDVIATCAFGIKIDSMKDPENKFYVYGKEVTNFSGLRSLKFLFLRTFPKLGKFFHIKLISKDASDFFRDSIQTTIATRDAEHITRPDMLQLMMDVRNKDGGRALNTEEIVAEAFVFFFAGFETTSTTLCFAAHLLATNPDVQFKLRQEIDKVLEESNGEVTYEAINHLEYLEAVINETLRMYCPVTVIERMCEADYELPPALPNEKPFVMKKGMIFWIPIFPIHYDEKYYDNPEEFRPERFFNKAYHNSPYYLPFGAGPRMCIANRFALLEIKVLLFHLLARCELKPCAKTTLPMRFSKKGVVVIVPENGFWLNIQRRSDMHHIFKTTENNDVIS